MHLNLNRKHVFNLMILIVLVETAVILNSLAKNLMAPDDFDIMASKASRLATHFDQIQKDEFLKAASRNRSYIYIDLGCNNGESVLSFFNGQFSYPRIVPPEFVGMVDWTVYAFEANPIFDEQLVQMKSELESPPLSSE